jgi:glycosyltransferase involved in cell wall biosynthesis
MMPEPGSIASGAGVNGDSMARPLPEGSDTNAQTAHSVLIINDTLCDNGSLRWAFELARIWLEANWSVLHFALKSHVEGKVLLPPAGVLSIYGDTAGARYRKALPKMVGRAIRAAAASDVVLVCSEVPLSLPFGYLIARVTRRPFVVYVQSIPEHSQEIHISPRERPIFRHCLANADAVLCVSPRSAQSAVGLGVAPAKVTLARTGIDVDAVRRRGLVDVQPTARHDQAARLVACGELGQHKGYDILIRALAKVRQTGRQVRLVHIGGTGPEGPALSRLARDLGVSDAVTFLGQVADPLREIARADAFVHSARVEAVGLVLLEALALGVPTIAADCEAGGPRMVLDGGRLGRLVAPESVPALAQAICDHLDDPTELRDRARQGAAYLREHFAAAQTAELCLAVLARTCSKSRAPRGGGARFCPARWGFWGFLRLLCQAPSFRDGGARPPIAVKGCRCAAR